MRIGRAAGHALHPLVTHVLLSAFISTSWCIMQGVKYPDFKAMLQHWAADASAGPATRHNTLWHHEALDTPSSSGFSHGASEALHWSRHRTEGTQEQLQHLVAGHEGRQVNFDFSSLEIRFVWSHRTYRHQEQLQHLVADHEGRQASHFSRNAWTRDSKPSCGARPAAMRCAQRWGNTSCSPVFVQTDVQHANDCISHAGSFCVVLPCTWFNRKCTPVLSLWQVVYLGAVPSLTDIGSGLRGQLTDLFKSCLGGLYFGGDRDAFEELLPPPEQ